MADNIQNTVTYYLYSLTVHDAVVEGNQGIDIILGSHKQNCYAEEVQVSHVYILVVIWGDI